MSERDAEARRLPARRTGLRIALGLAMTLGIGAVLMGYADPHRVYATIRGVDPLWLGAGLVLYAALQTLRAARYKLLAPAASARVLLGVHSVHALLLRIMPMRTGELGFAWLMRRSGAAGFAQSLVGILVVRILDLASVVCIFAAALALAGTTLRAGSAPSTGLAFAVGAVAAFAPLYIHRVLVLAHRFVRAILDALRLRRFPRVERGERALASALDEVGRLPGRVLWQVTGLTLVQWGITFALFWVLLVAMGIRVSIPQAILGGTGSVLGGLLPLAGVGNFGPLEAGWSLGFAAVGVATEDAVASAFGFSVISFGYAMIVGGLGWLSLPRAPSRGKE